eukprot:12404432-Karenia_brevis.AAC.1
MEAMSAFMQDQTNQKNRLVWRHQDVGSLGLFPSLVTGAALVTGKVSVEQRVPALVTGKMLNSGCQLL